MPSYTKTNWENYPNTTTPINANNLNKIEQGIYDNTEDITTINTNIGDLNDLETSNTSSLVDSINSLTSTTLFESSEGSTQQITLNDSTANYSKIDIQFKFENKFFCNTIYNPNGKTVPIYCSYLNTNDYLQIASENLSINQSTITRGSRIYINIGPSGGVQRGTASSPSPITKIIGYK